MNYVISKQMDGTHAVTFILLDRDEAVWFHDKVAVKVAKSGPFLRDVYNTTCGEIQQIVGGAIEPQEDFNDGN